MSKNTVQKAVDAAGGKSSLAKQFNITPEAVRLWEVSGRVPAERVLQLEAATRKNGRPVVTRHDLRPDIYPDE